MASLSPQVREQRSAALGLVASHACQLAAEKEALTSAMSDASDAGCSWREIARHARLNRATAQRRVERWQHSTTTGEQP